MRGSSLGETPSVYTRESHHGTWGSSRGREIKERLGSAVIKGGKVVKNVSGRALQRRVRRGRRINRNLPFDLRNHSVNHE
ncbi:MAG: hypothetical protein QNJ70_13670 [Xenococcaceae cyanobacterium MO_207.B15]|nr:hypothetical protein [Xenococcaceae cyanobacterium MO_207.B15]